MHRTPLGVLTAALALLLAVSVISAVGTTTNTPAAPANPAALVVPGVPPAGAAVPGVPAALVPDLVPAGLAPGLGPVEYSRPARGCRRGLVALTFDDGPSASVTMTLVRTLQQLKVPATFFMVGARVRAEPEIARAVQRAGFGIANHTWSHPVLPARRSKEVRSQLERTRQEFLRQRIVAGSLFRPPYGAANPRVRRDIRKLGLHSVLWSIDSFDWRGGTPRQIANRVIRGLRPNGTNVVLQHDGVINSPNSVRAVPLIVARARRLGYCFGDLDQQGRVVLPMPVLRAHVVAGTEDGPSPVRIRLDLDRSAVRTVRVQLRTASGTAEAGGDVEAVAGEVRFAPGVRTAWISVPVMDDADVENVEDIRMLLSAQGARVLVSELLAPVLSDDQF